MRSRLIFFCTTLLFSCLIVSAQYYETGQDPSSLKWKQIKTGRFTVIFPENYEQGGLTYARTLDEAYSKLISILPAGKFNIPVVIHNYTIQSNGYVAWAPHRMELYPTPEQNGIPLESEKQLATHELAHVLQMEALNKGFTKGMSFLSGEQFTGIVSSLLPRWFLEGDAVLAESAFTESGRGRDPAFQKPLKALLTGSNKPVKYDKILLGSYRDFVPNYYQSGFQMVTWALTKNDPQIWNKVLNFTGEEPFTINPVNISLTRSSGLRKKTLWKETSDTLKSIWTTDIAKSNPEDYESANPNKNGNYIDYYSPVYAGSDSLLAIKTSLSMPPSIVLLHPSLKTEERIFTPGQLYPWFISYGKGRLVWVETEPDPRWENREYSTIKLLDLKSRRVTKLSHRSRYLAASISPDGKIIAASENSSGNTNSVVIIDAAGGEVLSSEPAPGNAYLQHPQWSADGKEVTFIFLAEGGEGIISFNAGNRQWKILLGASANDLQSSFLRNDSLFFITSRSGTDNVYLYTPDKSMVPVTSSRFGVTDISFAGKKIYFSDYTLKGNDICSYDIPSVVQKSDSYTSSSSFLINRFNFKSSSDTSFNSATYTSQRYSKWKHLFRFHSWMPFYADLQEVKSDPASIRPGFSILTQNSLSTLISTLGYEYSADKRNVLHSRITWYGWYPVIESQLDYGTIPLIYKPDSSYPDPSEIYSGISFTNTISLPLQFSSGMFSEYLRPSLSAEYDNRYIYLRENNSYDYGQTILTARLYFSNYHSSAYRDIYPRWAQVLDFNYRFAPFDNLIYGTTFSLKTAFYLPGLFPNNGIRIKLEAEKQFPRKFLYSSLYSLPRGYTDLISTQYYFLSFDYVFPLVYPDFNLASLLYLKRIRTGLFYDLAGGPGNLFYVSSPKGYEPMYNVANPVSYHSSGIEMVADFHLFRIPFMISGGIRAAWKSFGQQPVLEGIFNIDLFGMTLGKRIQR